jgi:hypothetical protein
MNTCRNNEQTPTVDGTHGDGDGECSVTPDSVLLHPDVAARPTCTVRTVVADMSSSAPRYLRS